MIEYITLPELEPNGRLYRNQRLGTIEALIPNPWASCHAADLLELENGDLLCCWFAGSDEGNADVSIALSRLPAGENAWTIPIIVSDDATRSEQNPSLFAAPNGTIWLIYTAQTARTPEFDKQLGFNLQHTAEIRYKKSSDDGYTWGHTEVLFDRPGSFCRQKIQVLSSGRWVFGNWICFPDDTRNGSDITIVQISDDEGLTWRFVEMPQSAGRVHANILETAPGQLTALLRSRFADNIYRSISKDNGETWSIPVRTELRNNNSSISAITLQSGAIAMVYNDVSFNDDISRTVWPNQRCPVTVAISEDGGVTWPFRRIVEFGEGFVGPFNDINNQRYEYPVIFQGTNGALHIAYSWGNRKYVKYVQVNESWVRGTKICKGAEDNASMPCRR